MFGDILMWALTVFGLIPMLKVLFGPKKTFQKQLAEFSDDGILDDVRLCADWVELGEHLGNDVDPADIDDNEAARRWFQEIGECGDEYRRFSMLEDF